MEARETELFSYVFTDCRTGTAQQGRVLIRAGMRTVSLSDESKDK